MPNKTELCELCESECDHLVGCRVCGKLICSACEAADDGEHDEAICEACF